VRAANAAGKSAWSNEASGDTGTGPLLLPSPTILGFGKQPVGRTGSPREVRLTNAGTGPLQISEIAITGSGQEEFSLLSGGGPGALKPGESRVVRVGFTPSATGSWSARLTITDDAPDSPQTVALEGAGAGPALKISVSDVELASDVEFGPHPLGAAGVVKSLLLKNTGTAPLRITGISLGGAGGRDFAIVSGGKSGTVPPGASRALVLRFTPMAVGRRSAALAIRHNAGAPGATVTLGGTGVLPSDPSGQPAAARPVKAELRVIAIDGAAPRGGKIAVSPGQCVTLALRLKYRNGAVADLTDDPAATFNAGGGLGQFTAKNLWCPQANDAGRTITLYGRFPGLPGQPPIAGKVIVAVRRR
jgi:hypothetical protein